MIVYIATCQVSGKSYIGLTTGTLARRRQAHERYAQQGRDSAFHCALRKYGTDQFVWQILESVPNREQLQQAEIRLILEMRTLTPDGYNMTPGGDGRHGPMSESAVQKMRESQRRVRASETEEQRATRGAAISAAKKGKPQPWAAEWGRKQRGAVRSPEFRAKVSASVKRVIAELPEGEMARRSAMRTSPYKKPTISPERRAEINQKIKASAARRNTPEYRAMMSAKAREQHARRHAEIEALREQYPDRVFDYYDRKTESAGS